MKTFHEWLQKESVDKTSLPSFMELKSKLDGWVSLPDGPYCPTCWNRLISSGGASVDSVPLFGEFSDRSMRRLFQTPEGWFVQCEGCDNFVEVNY